MYATLDQVTLVRSSRNRRAGDLTIFKRWYAGQYVLTTDDAPVTSALVDVATRYGTVYIDAQGGICVVPDTWDEMDAMLAKSTNEF